MLDTPLTLLSLDSTPPKKRGLSTVTKTNKKVSEAIAEAKKGILAKGYPSHYVTLENATDLGRLAKDISTYREFGWDTETSGLHPYKDELYCITFWVGGIGYMVNFAHPLLPKVDKAVFKSIIGPYFTNPNIKQYTFNHAFDRHFLRENLGIESGVPHVDGYMAMWLVDENNMAIKGHGRLKPMCENYLGMAGDTYDALFGNTAWTAIDPTVATYYAIGDAEKHVALGKYAEAEIKKIPRMWKLYCLERIVGEIYFRTEKEGLPVDVAYLENELLPGIEKQIQETSDNLDILVSSVWPGFKDWGSPDKLATLLFEKLYLPRVKGNSTDAEVMDELSDKHPIIPTIKRFRQLTKLKTGFITPLLEKHIKGIIHPNMKVTGTVTGRNAFSNPNLQQMPTKESAGGNKIRMAFTSPKGFRYVSKDFQGQELRIMAAISKDALLRRIVENGEDLYSEVASIAYGGVAADYSKHGPNASKRDKAKVAVLALNYGAQGGKIAKIFGWNDAKGRQFVTDFYKRFSGLGRYQQDTVLFAKSFGYVEDILGRRRRLDYKAPNLEKWQLAQLDRLAGNARIQGSAGEQTKMAMALCQQHFDKKGYKSRVLFSIHDEIIFLIHDSEIVDTSILTEIDFIMTNAVNFGIEFKTTTEIFTRQWGVLDPTFNNYKDDTEQKEETLEHHN